MFCPKCRSEYIEGITECAHCEVELVAELPSEDTFASPEAMARTLAGKDLEAVMVGNHVTLGEMQRDMAEHRIPSVIAGEADQQIESAVHARFFLMVERERIPDVRALVEERWREGLETEGIMFQEKDEGEELSEGACPACGAEIPENTTECPECGLVVGPAEE